MDQVCAAPQGDNLTCPPGGYVLTAQPPQGRLDGLYCFNAGSSDAVVSRTAMSDVSSLVHMRHRSRLSGGAVFGIILAVLVGVAGLAGALQGPLPLSLRALRISRPFWRQESTARMPDIVLCSSGTGCDALPCTERACRACSC